MKGKVVSRIGGVDPYVPRTMGGRWVAVGTPVAQRPPHRSVRAVLPHTALASGDNAKAH